MSKLDDFLGDVRNRLAKQKGESEMEFEDELREFDRHAPADMEALLKMVEYLYDCVDLHEEGCAIEDPAASCDCGRDTILRKLEALVPEEE